MARRLTALLLLLSGLAAGLLLTAAPAVADARVSVSPGSVDPTYATTLRVSGTGFQAVKGGHGGIYVAFGTVKPGWQPTKGGVTGTDYLYVPDSEAKDNEGFQKYVAFPGSDTASSANGGVMSAAGGWSTELVVPGAVFQAYDRQGDVTTVDCRKVTCGVITIGAHGVKNATNETFTPVAVSAGSSPEQPAASGTAAPDAPTTETTADDPAEAPDGSAKPTRAGPATLEVDRASAVAGNVLAFTASGLPAGAQVSAVFDDGAAGAGPFLVGPDGTLAGVITLPAATAAGTHELRLYGVADPPSVMFAVQAGEQATEAVSTTTSTAADDDLRAAWLFAGAAALVLLVALVRLALRLRRPRAS